MRRISVSFGKLHKKRKDEGKVVEGLQVEFISATRSHTSATRTAFKKEAVTQRAWRHEQRRIFFTSRFVESASKEGGNKNPYEEAPHRGIFTWCQRRAFFFSILMFS